MFFVFPCFFSVFQQQVATYLEIPCIYGGYTVDLRSIYTVFGVVEYVRVAEISARMANLDTLIMHSGPTCSPLLVF